MLWFALGGAIPVIIHLLHRQKYRRVRWAAMEFLLAALKKTQRRLRIENLLLLLVRILIMVILALALSRPFFREAPLEALAESDTHHLFVIDNSASMAFKKAQESSLDVAKKTALKKLEELRKLTEQDKISVLLMSNYPEVFVPESNKKDLVHQRINEIRLSHFGTSALATFQKIAEVIEKSKNQDKRVYLFTDLQRNAWDAADETEARRFAELTKSLTSRDSVKVYLIDVGTEGAENRAVVDLRVENPLVTMKDSTRFAADVHNWSNVSHPSVTVNLMVDGALVKTESVALPAQSTISVSFKVDFVEAGAHHVQVSTEPDFLDVDDRRTFALEVKDGVVGLLVDGEPGNAPWSGEIDYLRFVLEFSDLFKLDRPVTPEMFETDHLERTDFIALCNVQSLTQEKVEKLEQFVHGGGGLLISVGGRVDRGWYNEFLWKEGKGLLPAMLGESAGTSPEEDQPVPVRVQSYREAHPIFRTFSKGLAKAPRELVFYQYFRLEKFDAEDVVARLDDNFATPLWVEKRFGEGRVLLYNSTMDDGWNLQVPGRPPYVVMMKTACEHLGARPSGLRNLFIGDFIGLQMTADKFQNTFTLDTPGEGQISISPEVPKREGGTFWIKYPTPPPEHPVERPDSIENEGLRSAGLYKLDRLNPRPEERPVAYFAVNMPPRVVSPEELHRAEGNLARIPVAEIRRRWPDFRFELIGEKVGEEVALTPPAAGLWKYLLYVLVGLLGLESVLAWLFGRAKQ
ncbi:MAG: VWA domain-containing protein [Planctomycetes bacterium]|nr:VWA domain-containing protein [Planctomycetota bacterium]